MNNIFFNKYLTVILLVLVSLSLGYWVGSNFPYSQNSVSSSNISNSFSSSSSIDTNLFNHVWNLVHTNYFYKNVNNKNLYYGAINGMVNSLGDPHTIFFSPSQASNYYKAIAGNNFAGIGVSLGYNSKGNVIIEQVLSNTPASLAGIIQGDSIVSVNGNTSQNINNVVNEIRGNSGTNVNIKVKTTSGSIKDFNIKREQIHVSSEQIKNLGNGIIDVTILRFSDSSLSQWENSYSSVMSKVVAMHPKKVILDLRGNPGGYFEAAIYAAGEFLPLNTLVAKQENRGGTYNSFRTTYQGNLQNVPLVILVNGGTASAAEIFSGAMQYYHRATIVGENTYGKGTAQNTFTFSDGALLVMTTKHWLLPSGRWITPQHPIIPNIKVKFSNKEFALGVDNQLLVAEKTN